MSKYRLVRDNYSATSQEWFLVQKWDTELKRWALVACGYLEAMNRVFLRVTSGPDIQQYEVIERYDSDDTKDQFKAREAKADLSV